MFKDVRLAFLLSFVKVCGEEHFVELREKCNVVQLVINVDENQRTNWLIDCPGQLAWIVDEIGVKRVEIRRKTS